MSQPTTSHSPTSQPGKLSGIALEDREGTVLVAITVSGILVRALVVGPIVLAIAILHRVAPAAPLWPSLVVVVTATAAAALPDSAAGLVTLGGLVAWWLIAVEDPAARWTFLVATCGLVFHVALALAAAGPPGCEFTRAVVKRLAARCIAVLVLTAGVAAAVRVAGEWGDPPVLVVTLTLVLVAALPWLASSRRTASREASPPAS